MRKCDSMKTRRYESGLLLLFGELTAGTASYGGRHSLYFYSLNFDTNNSLRHLPIFTELYYLRYLYEMIQTLKNYFTLASLVNILKLSKSYYINNQYLVPI